MKCCLHNHYLWDCDVDKKFSLTSHEWLSVKQWLWSYQPWLPWLTKVQLREKRPLLTLVSDLKTTKRDEPDDVIVGGATVQTFASCGDSALEPSYSDRLSYPQFPAGCSSNDNCWSVTAITWNSTTVSWENVRLLQTKCTVVNGILLSM